MLSADVFSTMFYYDAEPPDVERTAPWKGETDDFSQADSVLSIVNLNPQDELDPDDVEAGECWGIPCDLPELLQKSGAKKSKSAPPDISNGLGRSQSKRDIVKLEEHIVRSARFMVYDGVLCAYEKPCWRKLENEEAEIMIRKVLEEAGLGDCLVYQDFCKIRKNLRTNPRIQVKRELLPPESRINFLDGTYDLERKRLYPHDPDDYFFHAVKCRGGDMESCSGEVFEAFVEQLSDGDPAVRQQLLELTALTILGKQGKYFYALLGESHTGKTQFGRFLEELVGRENVESVRGVHDFSDRWTVGALKGKLLATCLDIPDAPLPKEAVGTIKQFVGDDPVKGERKNKDPFTFYRKPLLLFAGNHSLRIPNMAQEQALLNRMVVIPFRIDTRENDRELRLTIMASIAQEESRKTSQRVKWGQLRRMEAGVVFGNNSIYGFDIRGGQLFIELEEAQVVRLIYHKFLNEGKGTHVIARELYEAGIAPPKTSTGKWSCVMILRILRNEKYVGDLLQKKFVTPDFLTHKKVLTKVRRNRCCSGITTRPS